MLFLLELGPHVAVSVFGEHVGDEFPLQRFVEQRTLSAESFLVYDLGGV